LGGKRVQKLKKSVAVRVLCRSTTEDCDSVATGRLSVPPAARLFRLKRSARRVVPRTQKATLKLRIPRKARRAAKAALAGKKKVRARIAVRVADAGGNARTLKRTIRLTR
jgi:hypothetical protein